MYENAREVLDGGPPRLLSYGISDDLALSVGLPCGGEIDVFVDEVRGPLAERLLQVVERGERAVVLTVLEGDDVGAELLVTEDGERVGDAPEEVAERATELIRLGRSGVVEIAGTRRLRRRLRASAATADLRCHRHGRSALPRGTGHRLATDRRRRASPVRDPGATAERGGDRDRVAGRRPRPGAARPRDSDRRPDPRRQVRRPDDLRRARDRRVLHRGARLAQKPGAAAQEPPRSRSRRRKRSTGSPVRAASTSARRRRRRRRSRSSPRSWPSGPPATADASARRPLASTPKSDRAFSSGYQTCAVSASNRLRQCALQK